MKAEVSSLRNTYYYARPKIVDATVEPGKSESAAQGFETHGLVIQNTKGEVLFKQSDHLVKMEDVRKELQKLAG